MEFSEIVESGDRLQSLKELRRILAQKIEATGSCRDLASLSSRLDSVMKEIEELEKLKLDTSIDGIALNFDIPPFEL